MSVLPLVRRTVSWAVLKSGVGTLNKVCQCTCIPPTPSQTHCGEFDHGCTLPCPARDSHLRVLYRLLNLLMTIILRLTALGPGPFSTFHFLLVSHVFVVGGLTHRTFRGRQGSLITRDLCAHITQGPVQTLPAAYPKTLPNHGSVKSLV